MDSLFNMTTRQLKSSDIPKLAEMAKRTGYPYPSIGIMEHVLVVQDDDGDPLIAAGIKLVPEIYLWCGEFRLPLAKVHAIRLLHAELGDFLKKRGYDEANATLPPSIAEKFGRRLEKTFSWKRSWPSWFKVL